MQQTDFDYDVFISYRQHEPEKSWVRNVLAPSIENEGLKIFIDYKNFRLGGILINEMIRGVQNSFFTLAVMTPAYLESGFTEIESIMAEHIELENRLLRLIVIIRERCTPRLSLRTKLWLDMTKDSEYETNIQKIVDAIKH